MPEVQIWFSDYGVLEDDDFQGMFDLVFENTWLIKDKYSLFLSSGIATCIRFSLSI